MNGNSRNDKHICGCWFGIEVGLGRIEVAGGGGEGAAVKIYGFH